MKTVALLLCLAVPAYAQEAMPSDKPLTVNVKSGQAIALDDSGKEFSVSLPSGLFINDAGLLKLNGLFVQAQTDNIELRTQNDVLRAKVDELAAEPTLSVKAVVLIAVGALVVGAGAAVGITLAVQK